MSLDRRPSLRVEPRTIVGHGEAHAAVPVSRGIVPQPYLDAVGMGMTDRIGDRLANDPHELVLRRRREVGARALGFEGERH